LALGRLQRPAFAGTRPSLALGFTLIEVLVVVVILGILAAVVVPKFFDKPGEARQARAKADINALVTALNLYRLDNFVYPSTDQGLQALVAKPSGTPEARNWKAGGYLERLQQDPWGRDYLYLNPGQHGEIDVYTYGLDGQQGGEGENADIGNWTQ
jgi:general secretion pathway protein G